MRPQPVSRPVPRLALLLAGLATTVVLAGCSAGGDEVTTVPGGAASDLDSPVRPSVAKLDCLAHHVPFPISLKTARRDSGVRSRNARSVAASNAERSTTAARSAAAICFFVGPVLARAARFTTPFE